MARSAATKVVPDLTGALRRATTLKERVPIRAGRKVVAAVVPVEDLRRLEELEDRDDIAEVERRLQDPRNAKPIPLARVKARLGL